MVIGWQRQVAIRKGPPVDSNFSVFDVSVFCDSVSLCLCGSVSLCLWEEGVAATYDYFLGGPKESPQQQEAPLTVSSLFKPSSGALSALEPAPEPSPEPPHGPAPQPSPEPFAM